MSFYTLSKQNLGKLKKAKRNHSKQQQPLDARAKYKIQNTNGDNLGTGLLPIGVEPPRGGGLSPFCYGEQIVYYRSQARGLICFGLFSYCFLLFRLLLLKLAGCGLATVVGLTGEARTLVSGQ